MRTKIPSLNYRGKTSKVPSRGDGVGTGAAKDIPEYTGTEMLGISIIHKSCLQPIFSKQAAVDVANMRR